MAAEPPQITDAFGRRITPDGRHVQIDHETGVISIPGKPSEAVEGPTTGKAYEALRMAEVGHTLEQRAMLRCLKARWVCTQCKRGLPGTRLLCKEWRGGIPLDPRCGLLDKFGQHCGGAAIPAPEQQELHRLMCVDAFGTQLRTEPLRPDEVLALAKPEEKRGRRR